MRQFQAIAFALMLWALPVMAQAPTQVQTGEAGQSQSNKPEAGSAGAQVQPETSKEMSKVGGTTSEAAKPEAAAPAGEVKPVATVTPDPASSATSPSASSPSAASPSASGAKVPRLAAQVPGAPMTMEHFLDRLMIAESGGRLDAKNPRSTAVGPFQFIEGTFLAVARRYFAAETASLSPEQLLALRTDMAFSRRAAEAYTRENAAVLKSFDVEPTFPNLRLAFLLGPAGAAKVLKAPPELPLVGLLGPAVIVANPFMSTMTAGGLAARSAREVWQTVNTTQGVTVPPGTVLPKRALAPAIAVACNLKLPSCKRWLSLQTVKLRSKKGAKGAVAVAATAQKIAAAPVSRLGAPKAAAKR